MSLKVYNTLTRQKEVFIPLVEGEVGIYVCGVTPYNHPHIGNARPFVTWDVIRRYFQKKVIKLNIFKTLRMLMIKLSELLMRKV